MLEMYLLSLVIAGSVWNRLSGPAQWKIRTDFLIFRYNRDSYANCCLLPFFILLTFWLTQIVRTKNDLPPKLLGAGSSD